MELDTDELLDRIFGRMCNVGVHLKSAIEREQTDEIRADCETLVRMTREADELLKKLDPCA